MIPKRRVPGSLRSKDRRGFRGYPVATVAFYGPDDRRANKVAVGIVANEAEEVVALERWFSEADVRADPSIAKAIETFIRKHAVRSVVMSDRILGCPHEEGKDYPEGQACPLCPFWADRDRGSGRRTH